MDQIEKRKIIIEHCDNPLNKETPINDKYIKINSSNESCIDDVDVYILIEDNKIKDIKFDGEACAISISSSSIMTKNLVNKTISEALDYISNFENMLNNQEYNQDLLKEANVYDDIYKQNNRKTCALLPYIELKKILQEQLK